MASPVSATPKIVPKQPVDLSGHAYPALGFRHGVAVPSSSHFLGGISTAGTAQFTKTFQKGAIVRVHVTDNANQLTGQPDNIFIKPGISTDTIASLVLGTSTAMLYLVSQVPWFVIHLKEDQDSIVFGCPSASAKTMNIYACVLV